MSSTVGGALGRQLLVALRRAPTLGVSLLVDGDRAAGQVRRMLVELGPAYAKIGQVLSTRTDILPAALVAELATLRDAMPPEPPETIETVMASAFPDGLEEVFASFQKEPLAAGTVAQVHTALLKTGEKVAVKILRPGVEADLEASFRLLAAAARLAEALHRTARVLDLSGLVAELRTMLLAQTDLEREARNYRRMRRHFENNGSVVVPRVFPEHSCRDVLVMEYVEGVPPYDTHRIEVDPLTLARRVDWLIDDMIFVEGVCHADMHPGNFFWTVDGRLVLIDMGLVHDLTKEERQHLLAFYTAVLDGFGEFAAGYFLRHFITSGARQGRSVPAEALEEVTGLVQRHWIEAGGRPAFSAMFPDVLQALARHRLRLSHDYSRLFLTLVTMEGYLYSLDPAFDMLENARRRRVEEAEYASVSDEAHDIVFGPVASYSVARWADGDGPEEAYRRRDDVVLDALDLSPGSFLLDVGCGRGQLLQAAQARGLDPLGITISRVEHDSCRRRGLPSLLTSWEDFDACRERPPRLADAIASIEMDNHLATLHENKAGLLDLRLARFFTWARAHLRDDGKLFMQSLTVPDALLHDPAWQADYERLTDIAPWLGFSTFPQLVQGLDPWFTVEHAFDHSSDLLPTYEMWRQNTNRSIRELRSIVGDQLLVYLRRQLDALIWLAEDQKLQLYRLQLRAKPGAGLRLTP